MATRLYLAAAIPVDIHGNKNEIYFILNLTSNPTISQNIEFLKAINNMKNELYKFLGVYRSSKQNTTNESFDLNWLVPFKTLKIKCLFKLII